MNWYVLYTKPKNEKKVAAQLMEMDIEAYCPTYIKVSQWSDRKKKIEAPLFNSYVFVRIEEKERNKVFDAVGVVRYLYWLRKPAIVKDDEIEAIKNWLSMPETYDIQASKWNVGDRVVLSSGSFANQPAVIKDITKKEYTLVLESIGFVLKVTKKRETELQEAL